MDSNTCVIMNKEANSKYFKSMGKYGSMEAAQGDEKHERVRLVRASSVPGGSVPPSLPADASNWYSNPSWIVSV